MIKKYMIYKCKKVQIKTWFNNANDVSGTLLHAVWLSRSMPRLWCDGIAPEKLGRRSAAGNVCADEEQWTSKLI